MSCRFIFYFVFLLLYKENDILGNGRIGVGPRPLGAPKSIKGCPRIIKRAEPLDNNAPVIRSVEEGFTIELFFEKTGKISLN